MQYGIKNILLANEEIRQFHFLCYNDSFIGFYAILTIYLAASNMPALAATSISLGTSIKAGLIYLFPAFFGWVQYSHGLGNLIKAVVILVSIQFILASPFICDPVSRALGFKLGA